MYGTIVIIIQESMVIVNSRVLNYYFILSICTITSLGGITSLYPVLKYIH